MNKKILVVAALLMVVCVGGAFAWSIGVQGGGGYPAMGGAAITFTLNDSPLVFAADLQFHDGYFGVGLTGDYWFIHDPLVDTAVGPLSWFLGAGAGASVGIGNDYLGLTLVARLPIGLNMMIPVEKIEIEPYIQAVPQIGVAILPEVGLHWGVAANAGIRFHF